MKLKFLLFNSIVLLALIASSVYGKQGAADPVTTAAPGAVTTEEPEVEATTAAATVAPTVVTTVKTTKKKTTKPYKPYKPPSKNYGNKKPYAGNKYNRGDYDGYYSDNYQTGYDGIDPDEYGSDYGDFGPTYDNRPSMLQSLDIWVTAVDEWETEGEKYYQKGNNNYNKPNNNYNKPNNNYNKGKPYGNKKPNNNNYNDKSDEDNDNYNNNDRKKRSYSRVRFPVKQVKNYRQFPFRRMPPLISIFPWLPIFYDKLTYQTFIFSPTGGIYIIPPLINFYGQRFAVAQLIKWGYASLVSTGAPPPPAVDVAPLVQTPPPAGAPPVAGVVGSTGSAPPPKYDSKYNRFNGGVKTDFPQFKPRYTQSIEEGGDRDYKPNYKPEPNYGGNRNQEVYAQGGQRNNGGGGGGYNY